MKETGLMFKAPLVRAILDGSKTQTRRIAKTEITMGRDSLLAPRRGLKYADVYLLPERAQEAVVLCPFGQVGDRIYVRETHAQVLEPDIPTGRPRGPKGTSGIPARPEWQSHYVYLADGEMPPVQWHHLGDSQPVRWTPSIHMPKRAARIWLEITGVRVECLQAISEADAKAEGIDAGKYHGLDRAHARAFSEIWESTGGDWAANPWVWVIDFKRIEKPQAST